MFQWSGREVDNHSLNAIALCIRRTAGCWLEKYRLTNAISQLWYWRFLDMAWARVSDFRSINWLLLLLFTSRKVSHFTEKPPFCNFPAIDCNREHNSRMCLLTATGSWIGWKTIRSHSCCKHPDTDPPLLLLLLQSIKFPACKSLEI